MKKALYLVALLAIVMLFVPGLIETTEIEYLGVDLTTWIGGIGIIALSAVALMMSKGDIKSPKKTTKKKTTKKKK